MKKFALVTVGFEKPTPEIMEAWMAWFGSLSDRIVNQFGLHSGKEVKPDGVKDLEMDTSALTGVLVITAEDMDEALKIAQECPMITSTLVYEVMEKQG